MTRSFFSVTLLALLFVGHSALAIPTLEANHIRQGRRAFITAKKFAQEHNLPYTVIKQGGLKRIVLNVSKEHAAEYRKVFGSAEHYIEPFFTKTTILPHLRLGDRSLSLQLPYSSEKLAETQAHFVPNVAAPIALTRKEHHEKVTALRHTKLGPFDIRETGLNASSLVNETNWQTMHLNRYTGISMEGFEHVPGMQDRSEAYAKKLLNGPDAQWIKSTETLTPRMRVLTITTEKPLPPKEMEQLAKFFTLGRIQHLLSLGK